MGAAMRDPVAERGGGAWRGRTRRLAVRGCRAPGLRGRQPRRRLIVAHAGLPPPLALAVGEIVEDASVRLKVILMV
jgi:type II secretory pathway component PulM